MSDVNQLPASAAQMRPRPVIPPLPLRAAAYLIDIVILYFIGYTLETFARDQLLALGPLLPFLSTVLIFVYLWLGNGPVGRGATPGKSILNMHTLGMDGRTLGWRDALRRTMLHFPPVYTATFHLFREGLDLPVLWTMPLGYAFGTFTILIFALNGFAMLLHPARRGLHDLAGGSIVTGDPTPPQFAEITGAETVEAHAAHFRRQRKVLYFFGIVIGVILVGQWAIALFDPGLRADFAAVDLFNRELGLKTHRVTQVILPRAADKTRFDALLINPPPKLVESMTDGLTTETLRGKIKVDGETVVFLLQPRFGPVRDAAARSPEYKALLEKIRAKWNDLAGPNGLISPPSYLPARRIIISTADPFQFAMFPPRRGQMTAWSAEGPTDPALGGFVLEKLKLEPDPPKPQSTPGPESTTTHTLPTAR